MSLFLTVVVPTYNRHDDLSSCLECLSPEKQGISADRYEVVVSDDGTDSAQSVVDQFAFVRWCEGPRKGPAANRNRGASLAKGSLLIFTDDDCLPQPGWLAAFAHAAETRSERVFEGKTTVDYPLKGPFYYAPANETGGFLWSCNLAIYKSVFDEIGGFDEGFPYPAMEDVDLRVRLQKQNIPFAFVPEAVVIHPQRPIGSIHAELRKCESHYYFSRKHNQSLTRSGFSVYTFLQSKRQQIQRSRNLGELISSTVRGVAETLVLLTYLPSWQKKYFGRHD